MINSIEKLVEELNPQQKKAVYNVIDSCTKIVAGAGTGKTKIISKRFVKLALDLINQGIENPTSHLLVITFTDKAANEMKERIIKELNLNGLNSFGDELWISTFHGFCNKILRRHAIEAGLSPDFELAEESTLADIYQKIIRKLKYNEASLINNINAIYNNLGLTSEILDINNLKKLSEIDTLDNVFADIFNVIKKIKSLGLTPKEFLDKTLDATQKYSKTLNNLPFNIKTVDEYVITWENYLKPYTDDFCKFEKEDAFDSLCKKNLLICKNRSPKAEKWTKSENLSSSIEMFNNFEIYLAKVIAVIYAIYQEELKNNDIADFDDLINKTILILKNNNVIQTYYQKFFKHLIIDEFQDTNGSQLELIKLLLPSDKPNITFVGDRKQSIYGFRHAQMENLEVLHHHIEQKYQQKYTEIKLETNYRSSCHVLNAVNHVTTENLKLDEALHPNPNGPETTENVNVKNTEITGYKSAFERKELEAKYFAQEIQNLVQNEKITYSDCAILVKSHVQSELIEKILTRYGIPSVKKISKSFFNNPVVKNALAILTLVNKPTDEIALTKILKIDFNDKKLLELKNNIEKKLTQIDTPNKTKYKNLCEKIIKLYETNNLDNDKLNKIFDVVANTIKTKNKNSILHQFVQIEQEIPLYRAKREIEQFQNELTLRTFEKIISDYEQKQSFSTIKNFLEYFDKISEDKNFELPNISSTDINAVQILTIHASKGLEFPYTFVCSIPKDKSPKEGNIIFDLQYGNKPGFGLMINKINEIESPKYHAYKEIWSKPRTINEALRLFYVAVSRAEKYLNILTFPENDRTKPAFYTKDFPNSIVKNTINSDEIKPQIGTIALQTSLHKPTVQKHPNIKTVSHNYNQHTFSFSKLNTFASCPNKFLLKYKYNFPNLKTKNKGAEIGTIIHKLIYNSFAFNKIETEKEIISTLINYNVDETIRQIIVSTFKSFLASEYSPLNLKTKNLQVERPFKFKYIIDNQTVEFTGDIDLLIENEDKTHTIIDFKTNTNIDKDKQKYFKQLYLYKKALETEGLSIKTTKIIGINAEETVKTTELNNLDYIKDEFDQTLKNAIEHFKNGSLINMERNCKNCEYNYICSNNSH